MCLFIFSNKNEPKPEPVPPPIEWVRMKPSNESEPSASLSIISSSSSSFRSAWLYPLAQLFPAPSVILKKFSGLYKFLYCDFLIESNTLGSKSNNKALGM